MKPKDGMAVFCSCSDFWKEYNTLVHLQSVPMTAPSQWIKISYLIVALAAVAGIGGIFDPSIYAQEHPSWAAQGMGQDVATVAVVLPVFVVVLFLVRKGSIGAVLVWLGLLIYTAYSYALYAFFMHMGWLFLVYVALLGLSFYSIIGIVLFLQNDRDERIEQQSFTYWPSVYLLVNGVLFGTLWLLEILPNMVSGQVPASARDVGFWVNPVHVMDLAFILPAMVVIARLALKKQYNGLLLTVPLIVFAITMGVAIIAMIISLNIRGINQGVGPLPFMVINVLLGIYAVNRYIRSMSTVQAQAQ